MTADLDQAPSDERDVANTIEGPQFPDRRKKRDAPHFASQTRASFAFIPRLIDESRNLVKSFRMPGRNDKEQVGKSFSQLRKNFQQGRFLSPMSAARGDDLSTRRQ